MTQTIPGSSPGARGAGPRTPMFTTALRFGVVGAGGAAVNMLVLLVLVVVVHVPLLVASPVAVELAVVHNYLVNNRWTFGRRRVSMARFGKFNLSALSALLLNVAVVWALVAADVHFLLSNLVGIAGAATLNFGASTTWIWRGGRR